MIGKRGLLKIGAPMLACLFAFLPLAAATDGPQTRAGAPNNGGNGPALPGEFGEIEKFFKLEGDARKKFLAGVEEWHKDIMKIQAGVQAQIDATAGQIRKAQEEKDKDKEKTLEELRQKLVAQYWKERGEARLKILNTLTNEQLGLWMTELLWRRVDKITRPAMPTAEQVGGLKSICAEAIETYWKKRPDLVKEDPYLRSLSEQVGPVVDRALDEVFTEAQAGAILNRWPRPQQ